MRLWVVRGGKHGEYEETAFEKGLACLGFQEVGDLGGARSREDVLQRVQDAYLNDSAGRQRNFRSQLYSFAVAIERGDLLIMPLKGRPQLY